jgi:acyl-CoA thioester hydrolase
MVAVPNSDYQPPEAVNKAPFVVSEYVRWGDVDPAGIIRYDAYTRFMELGESELFRSLGISYREFAGRYDFSIPRRAMHLDFESPPTLDERLDIVVYVSRVGTTSLTLSFDFYGEGGVVRAVGYLVLVCVARKAMTSKPWPAEFLHAIDRYRLDQAEARRGRESAWQAA